MDISLDAASRDLSSALAAQHSRIKAMMTDVLNSDGAVRADSFAELCHYLAIHEAAEEEVMHPAVLAGADQSGVLRVIEDRLEEEKGAGEVIGQLEGIDSVDAPGFLVQFDLLHAAVQTHAEAEEEREVPILVAAGDAVAIGRVLAALARVDELAEDEAGPVMRGGPFAVMHERAREHFAAVVRGPEEGQPRLGSGAWPPRPRDEGKIAMMLPALNRATSRLTDVIERAHSLDSLAKPLSRAVAKVIPRGPVNDLLSGTGSGHPAHPALVLAPLGSWLSVTVLDLVGGTASRTSATRLLGIGNLAALPAIAAGANDWMDTESAERRVGLVHALANAGALTLFSASWVSRRNGEHRTGVTLSLAGIALATGAGWLGGHLGYGMGVGVDTTAFQSSVDEWTDVGTEDQVRDDTPIMVRAHGIPVLLARYHGTIYAMGDRCTHRGAPLHEGTVADGCVTCPWHGSQFRIEDGTIAHGPATRDQPRFEARINDGRIEVRQASQPRSLKTNPVA